MKTWKDISLYTFQQIERINSDSSLSDEDKGLFHVCEVFGLTEYELDNTDAGKVQKMLTEIQKLFSNQPDGSATNRIGTYFINYNPSNLTFGQYIELAFFLQDKHYIQRAHYALASISRKRFTKYATDGHRDRAAYFQKQPVALTIGSLGLFMTQFAFFNLEFSGLFGLDKELYEPDVHSARFNTRYGWTFSASRVAEYERITLDEAFRLPIRQAINDLMYLKELDRYQAEEQKKINQNSNGR